MLPPNARACVQPARLVRNFTPEGFRSCRQRLHCFLFIGCHFNALDPVPWVPIRIRQAADQAGNRPRPQSGATAAGALPFPKAPFPGEGSFMFKNHWLASVALIVTGLLHASAARAHTNDFETLLGDIGAKQAESAATGVGLALWKDGRTVHVGGVGTRDRSFSHPVDAHTHFRIGSISKMLVAIAVMQQVEAGRLRLQQAVSELAPELPIDNSWDATDPVRLVHLLEHSAGFDDMHFSHFHAHPEDQTLKDVLRRLQPELHVRWRPGSRFAYNNPGYGVAAYLVEKSSGMDYRDYVTERILQRPQRGSRSHPVERLARAP